MLFSVRFELRHNLVPVIAVQGDYDNLMGHNVELTRRTWLRSMAAAAGLAAIPTMPSLAEAAVRSSRAAATVTSSQTVALGPAGASGYRRLLNGPAEPRIVRTDVGAAAAGGRAACRQPLLAFAHFSDVHLVDHQSPGRVEWTDRFDDPNPTGKVPGIFSSAYRAHEMLSLHVADSMVRAVNAQGAGPVTGLPLAFMMQTGDNTDNSQYNETRWNIDVFDGKTGLRPDSGDTSKYEGVMDQDLLTYDPAYWHPDGAPLGKPVDKYQATWGFPKVPGVLDAARKPFDAVGLNIPWYSAYGNHDGLMQGNFPASTTQLGLLATGSLKIISPPAGVSPATILNDLASGSLPGILNSLVLGPGVRAVTADPNRRPLKRQEYVAEHFITTGTPVGHGFTSENKTKGTAYYSFDQGPFRFVVLDTVNPNGYADGSLDQPQFDWAKSVIGSATDKVVILFSHHTSDTMGNPLVLTGGDPTPRVQGPDLVSYLLTQPQVIAWVNGHTHMNIITPHPGPHGGFWEINTASHIDFPQQARLIEVANNHDGTWSIFTTVLDHQAIPAWNGRIDSPQALASLSRELAVNDRQVDLPVHMGTPADRTTELLVKAPPGFGGGCGTDPAHNPASAGANTAGAVGGAAGSAGTAGTRTGARGVNGSHGGAGSAGDLADTGSNITPELLTLGVGAVVAGEVIRRRSAKPAEPGESAE